MNASNPGSNSGVRCSATVPSAHTAITLETAASRANSRRASPLARLTAMLARFVVSISVASVSSA